jgi:hypothetical protein
MIPIEMGHKAPMQTNAQNKVGDSALEISIFEPESPRVNCPRDTILRNIVSDTRNMMTKNVRCIHGCLATMLRKESSGSFACVMLVADQRYLDYVESLRWLGPSA